MTNHDGGRRACWVATCRPPSASNLGDTNSAAEQNPAGYRSIHSANPRSGNRGSRRKNECVEERIAQGSSDSCPRDLDLLSGRPNIASCILAADLPEQLRAHQRSRCLAPAHTKGLAAMISAAPGATGDCREWRPTLSTRRLGRIRDSHGSWTCAAPTVRHFRQCERRGNRADLRLRPHKLRANARCPAGGARFRNAPQRLF